MKPPIEQSDKWSLTKKWAFRFFFLYFTLYIFLVTNDMFPFIEYLHDIYIIPFYALATWIGKHILHLTRPIASNKGSGDTTYDYIILGVSTLYSLIGMIVWSVIDKKRINYNKLFYWLTVMLRYYVAINMLYYGFAKFFNGQFISPSLGRLVLPYGESSPMGLVWTFFGYSKSYVYFMGIAEVSCGLLLFFRKTSALGALATLAVGINIMAINYCYDVCVKLLSTHLVIMVLFLISKDIGRLINFFILNKPIISSNLSSSFSFKKRWKNIALIGAKYILITYTIAFFIYTDIQYNEKIVTAVPPLYGLYDVKTFIINKDTLKPLTTDTVRWGKLAISRKGSAYIKFINDSSKNFAFNLDPVTRKIIMNSRSDTVHKYNLTYTMPNKDSLIFKGTYKKDFIQVAFHKINLNKYMLISRGFHWINETPFSR